MIDAVTRDLLLARVREPDLRDHALLSVRAKRLTAPQWRDLSEQAHLVSFQEHKPREWDRIDFALLFVDLADNAQAWATCREYDAHTLYVQFGGALPPARGTHKSAECFLALLQFARANYKRVTFLVENDNWAMLRMAMKSDFRVVGIRNYKGSILLEHLLEFGEGK